MRGENAQVSDGAGNGRFRRGHKPSAALVPAERLPRADQRHVQLFADAKNRVVRVAEEVHARINEKTVCFVGGKPPPDMVLGFEQYRGEATRL